MIKTLYRVFGYMVFKTTYSAGENITDPIPENRQWINFFTKGGITNSHTDADSTPPNLSLPDTSAGDWFEPVDFNYFHGTINFDSPTETIIWCLVGEHNRNYLPKVEKWVLSSGSTQTLEVGTKLALLEGEAVINSGLESERTLNFTESEKPKEISVRNGSVTITASKDLYAIKFL